MNLWHGAKLVGTEPLMGLNLGTGTPEQAAALVEYCNVDKGTKWSDLRRKHGFAEPYKVQHWCLGNEMDGPWQIGHMTATEYGLKAQDAARQMREVDPIAATHRLRIKRTDDADLSGMGPRSARAVLRVRGWAFAAPLFRQHAGGNRGRQREICRHESDHGPADCRDRWRFAIWCAGISVRRRNSGFRSMSGTCGIARAIGAAMDGKRQEAPHSLEEIYNLEDALLVGGIVNTLLRNADRVKIACLAQLVNVIAPIMTNANGMFRQTIYYPYAWALQYAKGESLNVMVQSPTYEPAHMDPVPYLDVAATLDKNNGQTSVFILNRDLAKARQIEIVWEDSVPGRVVNSSVLTGDDLKAVNSFDMPQKVQPQAFDKPSTSGGKTKLEVPARSYVLLQWAS